MDCALRSFWGLILVCTVRLFMHVCIICMYMYCICIRAAALRIYGQNHRSVIPVRTPDKQAQFTDVRWLRPVASSFRTGRWAVRRLWRNLWCAVRWGRCSELLASEPAWAHPSVVKVSATEKLIEMWTKPAVLFTTRITPFWILPHQVLNLPSSFEITPSCEFTPSFESTSRFVFYQDQRYIWFHCIYKSPYWVNFSFS